MSHSEGSPDKGPTTAYYQGEVAGIAEERDKVIAYLKQRVEDFRACSCNCCLEYIYVIEGIISDIEDSEHYER